MATLTAGANHEQRVVPRSYLGRRRAVGDHPGFVSN